MGRFFVGIQVAFAFCLVVAGASFLFSLQNLFAVNKGFDPHNVARLRGEFEWLERRHSEAAAQHASRSVPTAHGGTCGSARRRDRVVVSLRRLAFGPAGDPAGSAFARAGRDHLRGLPAVFFDDANSPHGRPRLRTARSGLYAGEFAETYRRQSSIRAAVFRSRRSGG